MPVEPCDSYFQCAPCVEAGSARVGMHCGFRIAGSFKKHGPFWLKEGKVAHLEFSTKRPMLQAGKQALKLK